MKGNIVICYKNSEDLPEIKAFLQTNLDVTKFTEVEVDDKCSSKKELLNVVGGSSSGWPIVFFNNDPITWKALQEVSDGYLKRLKQKVLHTRPIDSWPHPKKEKRDYKISLIVGAIIGCITATFIPWFYANISSWDCDSN